MGLCKHFNRKTIILEMIIKKERDLEILGQQIMGWLTNGGRQMKNKGHFSKVCYIDFSGVVSGLM